MSASPMARQITENKTIPTRRVYINDPSDLPTDYSSTPGGTLYSTTPGGTKIVYDKSYLLNLRNSPISKTPPTYNLPEHIQKGSKSVSANKRNSNNKKKSTSPASKIGNLRHLDDEDQFQMDM